MPAAAVHVVAGVIADAAGRILLTQRPAGSHLAGLWEFPGGKCEPGEAPADALRRELGEELGIVAGALERLIAIPWTYPEKSIQLEVFRVRDYAGRVHGREGQALRWVAPAEMSRLPMPPADRPVVAALRLPERYVITPEPHGAPAEFLAGLARVLAGGASLVQLRCKRRSEAALRTLAVAARRLTRAAGAGLLLNDHLPLVRELELDGVHLSSAALRALDSRPLGAAQWVGASCHDPAELAHAAAIGVDFVVLGPVRATASHAGAEALGWTRFAQMCGATPLPVYALGGMTASDLPRARAVGAIGVAGISAFWNAG